MNRFLFKPQLIPSLFCAALFVVLINLGLWQKDRASYKEQLLLQYEKSQQAEPLALERAVELGRDGQGFPIVIQGNFDSERAFLLDNRPLGTRPGFYLLSPFQTRQGNWVLVNRGWMPWNAERRMPAIPAPLTGDLKLRGKLYYPSAKQLVLQEDDFTDSQWPLLVQKLDVSRFSEVLGVELAPVVVRLDVGQRTEHKGELPRQWPEVNMSPEKHRAYSFQWFGMALALVVLFMVFSTEKISSNESNR